MSSSTSSACLALSADAQRAGSHEGAEGVGAPAHPAPVRAAAARHRVRAEAERARGGRAARPAAPAAPPRLRHQQAQQDLHHGG